MTWAGGGAMLALAVTLAVFSQRFAEDVPLTARPIGGLMALLGAASALYLVLALLAVRRAPSLSVVLLFAVLLRLPLLFSEPIQENDVYRYIWDGQVTAAGMDPYLFSPAEISDFEDNGRVGESLDDDAPAAQRQRQLMRLVALKNAFPSTRTLFARINHPDYATIYPAVAQWGFALHGFCVPQTWSVRHQVCAMKGLLSVFDFGSIVALVFLLRRAGKPAGLCLLYAWCPVVWKELANSGHMDAIPVCLTLVAILLACSRRAIFCGLALGLAAGAKFFALLVVPLLLRSLGWRAGVRCALALVMALVGVAVSFSEGSERREQTLTDFALFWENHDAVFLWIYRGWQLLFAPGDMTAVPTRTGGQLVETSYLLALLTAVALTAGVCFWNGLWTQVDEEPQVLLRRCFAVLVTVFLVGPLGFPWYLIWCLPFLPFVRLRAWLLLPSLVPLYYLRFWFDYHQDAGFLGYVPGVEFFDNVVVSLEFGCLYVFLLSEWALRRRQRRVASIASMSED